VMPRSIVVGYDTIRNNRDWAPSWQHEEGRRFLPGQVMKASHSNPEKTNKIWTSLRKNDILHLDSTNSF